MTAADDDESVTCWLLELRDGREDAAQKLWERYYVQLVRIANHRLGEFARRDLDEEDVALSAFHSFYQRALRNAFPQLNDRQGLWSLLVTITARKALMKKRHALRQRRGGGKARGESAFLLGPDDREGIARIVGAEPSAEFAAQVAEQVDLLLDHLGDDTLRRIAVAKMEGYSNLEIAEQLGLTDRTVRRKLKVIATIWESAGVA